MPAGNVIRLSYTGRVSHPEGYRLRTGATVVDIEGSSPAGAFYGTQTLRLLLPPETLRVSRGPGPASLDLPVVDIDDEPRFVEMGPSRRGPSFSAQGADPPPDPT